MNTKQKILPFFPLGVFLFPGEDMPLRIFEPRYLQLIEEAEQEEGFTFAIPYMKDDEMQDYGCEVKLQQVVAKSDQGRKVITIESVGLVKIHSFSRFLNEKLYDGGVVSSVSFSTVIDSPELIRLIIEYTDYYDEDFLHEIEGNELKYSDVVNSLNLSSEDKFKFFMLKNKLARAQFIIHQLRFLMMIRKQERLLNNDYHLN